MGLRALSTGLRPRGPSRRFSTRFAASCAAVVVCAAAVVFVAVESADDDWFIRAVIEALIVGVPLAAGLYAISAPRTRRFGAMLIAAALVWSLTALGEASNSLLYS